MTASPLAASDLPLKVLGGGLRRTGQCVLPRSRPSWQSRHHLAQSARLYIYIAVSRANIRICRCEGVVV
jgi:hypothetical protein